MPSNVYIYYYDSKFLEDRVYAYVDTHVYTHVYTYVNMPMHMSTHRSIHVYTQQAVEHVSTIVPSARLGLAIVQVFLSLLYEAITKMLQ